MLTSTIASILALAALATSATIPHAHRRAHDLQPRSSTPGYVTYCSNAAGTNCAKSEIHGDDCTTLSGVFPVVKIPDNRKCTLYAEGSWMKAFNTNKGKVKHVTGTWNGKTDPRAAKDGVTNVVSFFCQNV
ncbi:hypothetical protein Tdes44962_MAKER07094 [Teratosphaeria destructans]|uniref:Uncharacterized protein n=1 Tax=Teratosphaeria destructans TaxID=418781 RepID=A0A9W7T0H3_9PEZI|nr:hypothetical protein Tdes44962_MAKER07094 [Teratosphaeria destructans]